MHDYEIVLKDTHGKEIPMTNRGKQLVDGQNEVFTHVAQRSLKPHETVTTLVNLQEFYELGPGM